MPSLRSLAPFVGGSAPAAHPRCELCGAAVGERHPHVVELARRALRCACGACAVLFRDPRAGGGRYRTVPERVRALPAPDGAAWARLEIPVGLAFLIRRGDGWTAAFPSPGGPVEAPLSDGAAAALAAAVPRSAEVEPEVEALLLHRPRGGAPECFLVPIDAGYRLVGRVRRRWRGFDGGDEARRAIDGFLAGIRGAAR